MRYSKGAEEDHLIKRNGEQAQSRRSINADDYALNDPD